MSGKNSGIIDNDSVIFENEFKKKCLHADTLKIAAGYFYVNGFDLVKDELKSLSNIQIIMGRETDETNVLTLYYDNHTKIFKSEPINIRFTVPDNVSVLYCEYTHEEKCFTVKNILKPAEYSLEQEIENNELLINLTAVIAILTLIPSVSTIYKIFRNNSRIRSALKYNIFKPKFQRKNLEAFIAIIILFTVFTLYVLFIASIIMSAL